MPSSTHTYRSYRGAILAATVVCLTVTTADAQRADTVHFELDMQDPIEQGWLDVETDTVGIRGDQQPLSWGETMAAADSDGDGRYTVSIPFRIEGDSSSFAYKIKVDGPDNPNDGWQEGPNRLATIRRGQSSHVTNVWSEMPAQQRTFTGTIEIIEDVDAGDLLSRDVLIYLPPGYEDDDRRYPVLYMHDGYNVFDASAMGQEWRMDEAAEALIPAGEIQPIIIVGISNTADRIDEYTPTTRRWGFEMDRVGPPSSEAGQSGLTGTYVSETGDTLRAAAQSDSLSVWIPGGESWQPTSVTSDSTYLVERAGITLQFLPVGGAARRVVASKPPQGGKGPEYARFVVETVKPYIDANYRTMPERASTALGGSSLGGLITMYMGLEYPDVFGGLLVVSPSVWWDNRWIVDQVAELPEPTGLRVWLDIGTAERGNAVDDARVLRDALVTKGWREAHLRYVEDEGGQHTERAWAERVPDMLRYLFPPE